MPWQLPGFVVSLTLALGAIFLTVGSALADGGPHGQYDKIFDNTIGITVTSKHNVQTSIDDPGETESWGYYARTGEKSYYLGRPLTCSTCHNPHGSQNYRILRERVGGSRVSVLAYGVGEVRTKQQAR